MAAITTAGSGNWTSTTPNAPWPGGTVPTSADTVTIAKNHTVTLNATTCVATSVTLALGTTGGDAGGVLTASLTASSKLTLQQGITAPGSATVAYSTYLSFDMRSANAGVVCELVLNNVNATGVGNGISTLGSWNLRGAVKARWSTINSALVANSTMSVVIADCTGWAVGDKLVFATTSAYNATPRTDEVTIATITPGAGTTATVTWTDGTGTGGAVAYAHASGCPVGNFTSNLVIRPGTNGNVAYFHATGGATSSSVAQYFTDVESRFCRSSTTFGALPVSINTGSGQVAGISNNAFYGWDGGNALFLRGISKVVPRQRNIFYTAAFVGCLGGQDVSGSAEIGPDEEYAIFRAGSGVQVLFANQTQRGHRISGVTATGGAASGAIMTNGRANLQVNDCQIWSSNSGIANTMVTFANDCAFGSAVFPGCDNSNSTFFQGPGSLTLKDCIFPPSLGIIGIVATLPNSRLVISNKNADPAVQEIYGSHSLTVPIIQRDTSLASTGRSTSAMLMTLNAATAVAQSFNVLAKAGQTIDILCLVRKSGTPAYGASTLPSVTVSGLGITPVVATMSGGTAADTWETLIVSATNSGVADGELTVTFTAQSATAGAKAWFSGVPVSPFVTRCRHYGYTFDETNPTRTVNPTVSAAEATAAAYTGMTVTWGTSASSVDFGGDQTFQKLYDYTQAQACLNVGSALPLFGAGVAGSPVLFAQGSITTIGYTLNGVGALVLGDNWLFASVPWSYQYYGGTFSQLTTVPSFGGGTLQIGDAGTYTFDMTADMILDMTPTSTGTYNFALCNITGEVDLSNASAHAINVQLPAGTSYTTANNTGGAITVSVPTVTQGLNFTGLSAGSQVKVFTTATTSELFSDSSSGTSETWSQAGGSDTVVDYTIMKAGFLPIRVVGVTVNSAVVVVPVSQVVDRSYSASSGLSYGSTATVNTGTSRFTVTVATTIQNWYSFMIESWIAEAGLKNRAFPISSNGPNSFTLEGWEFSAGLSFLYRDGLRYTSAGVATAIYSAIYSVDTEAGMQVRYQQADGTGTTDAATTGKIDQLIQVYGDASHGNFDKRGFLTLKVQRDGYDQAETDVVSLYGSMEDQLYVVGLNPISNGLATGSPFVAGSPTITDHGASPVTWNSKQFSITITDSATGNTAETLMRWIRYNLDAGGAFEGKDGYNWHDLVQLNGAAYKTVRGAIYGDTGASLKGVRVLTNAGDPHPDFNLFTADDGTTYAPPPQISISIFGVEPGSRVQLYDTTNSVELLNEVAGIAPVLASTNFRASVPST